MLDESVIKIDNLSVTYNSRTGPVNAVKNISWQLSSGEAIGICGESGSGKTTTALAIIGLLPLLAAKTEGVINFNNMDLLQMSDKAMRSVRGKRIAMIFQETTSSLNPALTIGRQISESLFVHQKYNYRKTRQIAMQLLESVGISEPEKCLKKYPHQLSGGMQQRVMIAMAISCKPEVLIADEPMSSLDSALQLQIKNILNKLKDKHKMAMVLISHDLRSVSDICDKTVIMYEGAVVEAGPSDQLMGMPAHPYTRALIDCIPQAENTGKPLKTIDSSLKKNNNDLIGCVFASRCGRCMTICKEEKPPFFDLGDNHEAACWLHAREGSFPENNRLNKIVYPGTVHISQEKTSGGIQNDPVEINELLSVENLSVNFNTGLSGNGNSRIRVVRDVSFSINRGETFGLIGESGCGKTTLARTIMGLYQADDGKIFYKGIDLSESEKSILRQSMQYVFQDPFGSLNPRMTVKEIISETLDIYNLLTDKKDRSDFLYGILKMTGLAEESLYRYPHEFSGGQRQRIAISRALAAQPEFIILDEPVSSLDVSVQAKILNLLTDLKMSQKLTYLFISHDLSVVRHISDKIGVMYRGQLIETGSAAELFSSPLHPYTRDLIAASADISVRNIVSNQKKKNEANRFIPAGHNYKNHFLKCEYSLLCSHLSRVCLEKDPVMDEISPGHSVRCHLAGEI